MKRIFAMLGIAALLAVAAFTGNANASPVKACGTGWYVYHYGNVVSDSYYNYALGHYSYINFQSQVVSDNCQTTMYGRTRVWVSDGYNLTGGTVYNREDFQGGSSPTVTPHSANGLHDFYTQGPNYYGGVIWDDDLNTLVVGPFGGNYGGYTHA